MVQPYSLKRNFSLSLVLLFAIAVYTCDAVNKYSKEANQPNPPASDVNSKDNLKDLEKPFRLAKINLIWAKAQKRLTDLKLKNLFSELKVQDKEELQLKRLKANNLDKDGLKESEIRKKFGSIIDRYGLADHFDKNLPGAEDNNVDNKINNNAVFKDKKLNKLWLKAESAGFSETELKLLKDEFAHHQEKVLQFYSILEEHNSRKLRENNAFINEVHIEDLQNLEDKDGKFENLVADGVRDSHRDLKTGYDRLERMALSGPKSKDFEEPKVQSLWKIALNGDFSSEELESLRTELRHYEQRLIKLRYLHGQNNLIKAKESLADEASNNSRPEEDAKDLKQRIKLQERKVEKLHNDLEARITQRHFEL